MRKSIAIITGSLVLTIACEHGHQATNTPAKPSSASAAPPANPVQAEMRLLNEAMRDAVTAIAYNDLASIPKAIHGVHLAREVTAKALADGAYRPPKRASEVAAFEREDEAFHDELVKLVKASRAGDLPAATHQLGVVLDGCTACHTKYRF